MDIKRLIPFLVMPLLLVLVEIGALLISLPVQAAGITAFEDPTSVAKSVHLYYHPAGLYRIPAAADQIRSEKDYGCDHRGLHLSLHLATYFAALVYTRWAQTDVAVTR